MPTGGVTHFKGLPEKRFALYGLLIAAVIFAASTSSALAAASRPTAPSDHQPARPGCGFLLSYSCTSPCFFSRAGKAPLRPSNAVRLLRSAGSERSAGPLHSFRDEHLAGQRQTLPMRGIRALRQRRLAVASAYAASTIRLAVQRAYPAGSARSAASCLRPTLLWAAWTRPASPALVAARRKPSAISVGSQAAGRRAGGRSRGQFPPGSRGAAGPGHAGRRPGCSRSYGWRPRATRRTRVLRDGVRGRGVSSRRSEVDRDLLGVTGADRRGATLLPVGGDHLPGSIEQHLARLLDSAPACHHRGPLGQLRHRPPVLIRGEHSGQCYGLAHRYLER